MASIPESSAISSPADDSQRPKGSAGAAASFCAFPEPTAACPCGSGLTWAQCCGPFLDGGAWPETAEALMRSRYSAYALGRYDWLVESTHPARRADVSAEQLAAQAAGVRWLRLDVDRCADSVGTADDERVDLVEYHAIYELDGIARQLGECAFFSRVDGRLYYLEGRPARRAAYRRPGPKTGRNDPCPCGSGRKFKKCCGRGADQA